MRDELKKTIQLLWPYQDFDHLGMAIFSLKDQSFELCEFHEGEQKCIPHFYFDLASLTKPLTMGALSVKNPQFFVDDKKLLLEHRGGLPAWAILGKLEWQDTLNHFEIKESDTLYSDLSMLRLMLILEKETGQSLQDLTSFFRDRELCFWKELPDQAICPDTGFRNKRIINGEVNDDNCFKINRFCPHAGLFSTLEGLTKSLLNLEKEVGLKNFMQRKLTRPHGRFVSGWDTISDANNTLAGRGAPAKTFGHLGFTGTSMWIDADSGRGWILLTNATKKYWYHRKSLNQLRRDLGALIWS